MKPKGKERAKQPEWITRREPPQAVGFSEATFDRRCREAMGDGYESGHGTVRARIHLPTLRGLIAEQDAEALADGDAMLAKGASPALERYRNARADLAELELKEKRGGLVALSQVHGELEIVISHLNRFNKLLGERFGNEGIWLCNQVLQEMRAEIEARFGGSE